MISNLGLSHKNQVLKFNLKNVNILYIDILNIGIKDSL